ncbi:MAG TPA: FAD:protein FMN transferase [Solirubrobacteraceae bacterium]|jgi:thiamine biosynthesis lipoprotein|nr:FAD:protein FMN transferase [Solirubrobacteraceae bacterium]
MFAHERWRALGTTAELLVCGGPEQLALARGALERVLAEIDLACSRFRDDSELSRLNAANGRPLSVSPLFLQAVELALRAARVTDGDLDPTLGRALEQAGYDCDWELLAASQPVKLAGTHRASLGLHVSRRQRWRAVRVDRAGARIALPRGVKLDLGATAKAWAADLGVAQATRAAGCSALVSLGGDLATAGRAPQGGWQVHVTDDHRSDPSAPGQTIAIAGGGVATSSTTVRRWLTERASGGAPRIGRRSQTGGVEMHHIVDPATQAPARSPWRTVSVAAATCAEANIAATAAIVRGARAPQWLHEQGLPARLVHRDGGVETVGAWPVEPQDTLESAA